MAATTIIDCDPGNDDAIALLLALASPEIAVAAITVVAGNVGLDHTSRNARAVAELAGRPVPVYEGAAKPLLRPAIEHYSSNRVACVSQAQGMFRFGKFTPFFTRTQFSFSSHQIPLIGPS